MVYDFKFGDLINLIIFKNNVKSKFITVVKKYDIKSNILHILQPRLGNLSLDLEKSDKFEIKFNYKKMVHFFSSVLIESYMDKERKVLVYKIKGPNKVQTSDLRKELRIHTLPSKIEVYSYEYSNFHRIGILNNISFSGLNFIFDKPISHPAFAKNKKLILFFSLPDEKGIAHEIKNVLASIKWSLIKDGQMQVAVKFEEVKPTNTTDIQKYIIHMQRVSNWELHLNKILK
jgi:c-di-GMP-binding flagellar brake protein YcgR